MLDSIKSSNTYKYMGEKLSTVYQFIRKFLDDWSLNFAAMLAYYLLVSLIPLAIVFSGILGLILRNNPDQQNSVGNKISSILSSNNTVSENVKDMVNLALKKLTKEAAGILSIGIVLAIFGSSRLFVAIDDCMCIVYRLPQRSFIHKNLLAFGAVFMFVLIIPIMIFVGSAPAIPLTFLFSILGRFGIWVFGIICSLIATFIFFEFIYWVMPNKKMSFKVTWCGALTAAIILDIYIILFPFYVQYFMGNYTGQIGFAIIAILFLYYFATIIILGAQINAFFFENYRPLFDGLGTYISSMHEEYGVDNPQKPLISENDETRSYTN